MPLRRVLIAALMLAASCSRAGSPQRTVAHTMARGSTTTGPPFAPVVLPVPRWSLADYVRGIDRSRWYATVHKNAARRADYHSFADWPLWRALGRCEQPGRGADGINWTHRGSYPGGLGVLDQNFRASARALGLPYPASSASPGEQIRGARWLAARFGLNGWACYRAHHREWGV